MVDQAYLRHGRSLGGYGWGPHGSRGTPQSSLLSSLCPLNFQGLGLLLLFKLCLLLLAYLLPLVLGCSPFDHLHGIKVAVGGLADGSLVHSVLRGMAP